MTYDNLSLISAQHSLHLYQPVTLPNDYLTGEAVKYKDIPIEEDWKDHVIMMPTAGLFGYNGGNIKSPKMNKDEAADMSALFSSSYYTKTEIPRLSSGVYERETIKPLSGSFIRQSLKPSHVLHPFTADEMISSTYSSGVIMTNGSSIILIVLSLENSLIDHGIVDVSHITSTGLFISQGDSELSPITEGGDMSSQTHGRLFHISSLKRSSNRRIRNHSRDPEKSLKSSVYTLLFCLKERRDLESIPQEYNHLLKEYGSK